MKRYCGCPLFLSVLPLFVVSISFAQTEDTSEQEQPTTAVTLSEVDQAPLVMSTVDPLYPSVAKREGIQGKVTLWFIVTKEGKVVAPMVVKAEPPGVFNKSALKAILQWRFKPAFKDGNAVDATMVLPMKFEIAR